MIPEGLLVYESYIDCKMTKRIGTKECLELLHTDMYETFSVHEWGGYEGMSSLLVMITLGLDMYIGDLMPWIYSLNLRWDHITYLGIYTKSP